MELTWTRQHSTNHQISIVIQHYLCGSFKMEAPHVELINMAVELLNAVYAKP